ncbi:MAG: hypothetical protein FWC20_04830 [Oscillospiraceae bacterium]|nr:hypothetical protein [Oscillospiraceae bacterium]MCL2278718.1 hypothetical protein [Oscillospiraceae bacterium]
MNENTNTSTNQTAPKVFEIIDGNTLMAQEYERYRLLCYRIRAIIIIERLVACQWEKLYFTHDSDINHYFEVPGVTFE